MFCSECGKEIDSNAKFCPNCGYSLQKESITEKVTILKEEFVIYKARKHWVALLPCFFLGVIFLYTFCGYIYLSLNHQNTDGFGTLLTICSILIFYSLARFIFDKIEITNKSFNMRQGIINIERINLPIDKINMFYVKQDLLGRILDYGSFIFESAASGGISTYPTISEPNKLVDIMNNIENYI